MHIFREHNKEADAWAGKGARGLTNEREDESDVVWLDVKGICGFWDGSCRKNMCGACMWITFSHRMVAFRPQKVRIGACLDFS